MHSLRKILIFLAALVVLAIVDAAFVYRNIPTTNTNLTHFDTIIVLGTPANPDGSPSPEQRERTLEGIREFKAGTAPHLIFTGAAAHNQFVEAHTMATLAEAEGVSPDAIIEEGQAQNTVQEYLLQPAHHGRTRLDQRRSRQLPQPSSAHRSYTEELFDAVEHSSCSMATRIHFFATSSSLRRRSGVLPETANPRLPPDALSTQPHVVAAPVNWKQL
jgi:hypothetical protein